MKNSKWKMGGSWVLGSESGCLPKDAVGVLGRKIS
jgi:hypothetical protein